MKALRQAIVAAALVLAAVPVAADAKVYVAPNSPAGFQYGAPLESARREGAGGQGIAGAPGAAERAPVFGKGVGDSAGAPGDRPGGKPASEDGSSAPVLKRTQGDDGNAGLAEDRRY